MKDPVSHTISRIVPTLLSGVNKNRIAGVLVFGSVARGTWTQNSDLDIGIVHRGDAPLLQAEEGWDLFLWSDRRWDGGFALQLEIARGSLILHDPSRILVDKITWLQTHLLDRWGDSLIRL